MNVNLEIRQNVIKALASINYLSKSNLSQMTSGIPIGSNESRPRLFVIVNVSGPHPMRPLILCGERLYRVQRILERFGGKVSLRDLRRSFVIFNWEIEQADSPTVRTPNTAQAIFFEKLTAPSCALRCGVGPQGAP